jgi:hypothetical protein
MTIEPRFDAMIANEEKKREEDAQDEAVETYYDQLNQGLEGLDWRTDPEGAAELAFDAFQAARNDMGNLPNFDAQDFNKRYAGYIISLAKSQSSLAPFEAARMKNPNGGSLMTSKQGNRLRDAETAMRSALAASSAANINSLKQTQWKIDTDQAADWRVRYNEKDLFARTQLDNKADPMYISASRAQSLLDKQTEVIEAREVLVTNMVTLAQNGAVTDPTELHSAVEEIIKLETERNPDPAHLNEVRLTSYAQSGQVPNEYRQDLNARIVSGNKDTVRLAINEARDLRSIATNLYTGVLGDSGENALLLADTLDVLGIDERTQDNLLTSDMRAQLPGARKRLRASSELRGELKKHLDGMGLSGGTESFGDNGLGNRLNVEKKLLDVASALVVTGNYNESAAMTAAAVTLNNVLVDVGDGQRVLPSEIPAGFGSPVIREEYKDKFLRRIFNNRGLDPDDAMNVAMSPDPLDPSRVLVSSGDSAFLGSLPWTEFASRVIAQQHAGFETALEQATRRAVEDNKKRFVTTTPGAVDVNPNPLPGDPAARR